MDIGGALAEARSEAGLTITQVSERTRIRATIIRDIEHDDYSACGGDYYARGHIRAIAKVVGTDPVPLIEEYDAARMPPPDPAAAEPAQPTHHWRGHAGSGRDDPDADTNPDLLPGTATAPPGAPWPGLRGSARRWAAAKGSRLASAADPHAGSAVPNGASPSDVRPPNGAGPPSPTVHAPASTHIPSNGSAAPGGAAAAPRGTRAQPTRPIGITAAEAFRPGLPLDFERRRPRRTGLLVLIALVVIGVVIYLLVSGGSPHHSAPPAGHPHHGATAPAHGATAAAHGKGTAAKGKGAAAATSATPSPSVGPIAVAGAAAFGPGGVSQGDDPQGAALAIDGSQGTAWHTDWYATADLGGLQSGTGLLLRLGSGATVTSATILLRPTPGGTIQLRAGDLPALANLPVVAQAANPGGTLTMRLTAPVRADYVLIWFTSLPPDNTGTYQASVYDIRLSGTT